MDSCHVVGKSFQRIDGIDKVTGAAKYATDLKFDNMLVAGLLRSPHAHAKVTRIDTSAAEKLPGVKAVVSILDVPKVVQYWFFLRTEKKTRQMFLQDNIVRFVGDPILAIAAKNERTLKKALCLVKVEYEPLKAIHDPEQSLVEKEVSIHKKGNIAFNVNKELGNIQEGFDQADVVVENTYHTSKQKHASIEPIGTCVADYRASGKLTVYSSTQLPHWSRNYIAAAMDLPLNKVRVIKPYTGGAFGGRCGVIHGLEMMCCTLSKKTLRTVKISFTREEDFCATESRHPMTIQIKTGATKQGVITANKVNILSDTGGYGTHYIGVIADCMSTGIGLYKIPNYSFSGTAVYTNRSMSGALRGYGNPQMNFAQESQIDILAQKIGMDPMKLRLKNYRRKGEIDPIFNEEILSNGLEECLEKGALSCKWEKKRKRPSGKEIVKKGIGLSAMLHGTGAARALPDPGSATVMINSDGTVNLQTAAADEGQGSRTVLAQVAAEILGVEFEDVSVSETDTDITPLDCGTHGSRQAYCGGLAVRDAAMDARKQMLTWAEKFLNTDQAQLTIEKGMVSDKTDPENRISVKDLMRKTQIENMGICEQIIGSASGIAPAMPGYYGAVFAEVEVNTRTGAVKVTNLTSAYDVGKAISPEMVKGQIVGGSIMGIGYTLTEGLQYENHRMVNPNFTDYRILRSCDIPELDPIIVESNEPTGPFGAKGIGEGSMVNVASAISNAICHATGVRLTDLCITPESILKGLNLN